MKINEIKRLAEKHSLKELKMAEQSLYDELPLPFPVDGAEDGERLTHILAAIWIREDMEKGNDLRTSIRRYSEKVRNSIN